MAKSCLERGGLVTIKKVTKDATAAKSDAKNVLRCRQ